MGKKLKLKWVSDIIGDEYKKWNVGANILLQAQTGAGKTYFITNILIPYLKGQNKRVLYICNRTNLKRQVKKDLLKQFNKEIPNIDDLDKLFTIENVTVMSYQAIQEFILDQQYGGDKFNINCYDYIICDEIHYMLADAGFQNKTRISVDELIREHMPSITRIFISATMEQLENLIITSQEKLFLVAAPIIYKTGEDYSYINPIAFNNNPKKDIIKNLIINDKSKDKWVLFVTKKQTGEGLKKELLIKGITAEFIKSGSINNEVDNIVNNSKFNSKVLICTKAMDNGININDDSVKNIVIWEYDYITFKQCLGRIRIDIENAREINLYIPKLYKNSFTGKLKRIQEKLNDIKLLNDDYIGFCKKYDNSLNYISTDIFYQYKGKYIINRMGAIKAYNDRNMCIDILIKFKKRGENAFIEEALTWIGLFDEHDGEWSYEYIDEPPLLDKEIEDLESYFDSIVGNVMLQAKDRKELIEKIHLIDTFHSNIKKGNIKLLKNITTLNSYLDEIGSNYTIKKFETSKIVDEKKKNYKEAWKVMRLSDE